MVIWDAWCMDAAGLREPAVDSTWRLGYEPWHPEVNDSIRHIVAWSWQVADHEI